jgi:hypothetical protein
MNCFWFPILLPSVASLWPSVSLTLFFKLPLGIDVLFLSCLYDPNHCDSQSALVTMTLVPHDYRNIKVPLESHSTSDILIYLEVANMLFFIYWSSPQKNVYDV